MPGLGVSKTSLFTLVAFGDSGSESFLQAIVFKKESDFVRAILSCGGYEKPFLEHEKKSAPHAKGELDRHTLSGMHAEDIDRVTGAMIANEEREED